MSLRWRQSADDNEVACAPRLFLIRLRQDDAGRVRTWRVDGQRRSVSLHGLVAASVYRVRIVAVDCNSRNKPSRWVTVKTAVQTATNRQQRDQHHRNCPPLYVLTSANAAVMRSVRFVCHPFCLPPVDYCKSNQPISLKLGVMIGPTNRKN